MLLLLAVPVGAVKLEEGRGIGHGERCLDDDDVVEAAGGVHLFEEFLVEHALCLVAAYLGHLGAETIDTGHVGLSDEVEFAVVIDVGKDVGRSVDVRFHLAEHLGIRFVGVERRDAVGRLEGIGHVSDDDPVAVAEEGQLLGELSFPVAGGSRLRSGLTGGHGDND